MVGVPSYIFGLLITTEFIFAIPASLLEVFGVPMFLQDGDMFPTANIAGWIVTNVFKIVIFWQIAKGLAFITYQLSKPK